ncbi:hypothetical protein MTR_5g022650 [Medicago truncatula]|uniref:Uncharacterized protein n=1 Tax=Medicago truncatula TaxID=3880 RepID=G7JXK6_MEDTR|nr:hypothetical protein MTR_5g022650 [Medicago truncatula]
MNCWKMNLLFKKKTPSVEILVVLEYNSQKPFPQKMSCDLCFMTYHGQDDKTSLVGKHVWDMLQGTGKLWVKNLSHKHTFDAHSLSHANTKTLGFIIKAKNILKDGFTRLALLYTQLPQDIIDQINNPNLHFNPDTEDIYFHMV